MSAHGKLSELKIGAYRLVAVGLGGQRAEAENWAGSGRLAAEAGVCPARKPAMCADISPVRQIDGRRRCDRAFDDLPSWKYQPAPSLPPSDSQLK